MSNSPIQPSRSLIDPALNQLIWTLMRAGLRKTFRSMKTPAGAVAALFFLISIGFAVFSQVAVAMMKDKPTNLGFFSVVIDSLPIALFMVTALLVITDAGKTFLELRPPELQFVLAGPFSDSQVLSYRLTTVMIGWGLMALFFSTLMMLHVQTWVGGLLAVTLGGGFMMMTSFVLTLLGPRLGAAAMSAVRIGTLIGLAVLAIESGVRYSSSELLGVQRISEAVNQSVCGKIVSVPFQPFANLAILPLGWSMLANAMIGLTLFVGVVACCYLANAGFSELAVEGVARRQQKMNRVKGGNIYAMKIRKSEQKQLLPAFPWFGGMGPVAWSQLTTTIRRGGRLLPGLLVLGAVGAIAARIANYLYPGWISEDQRMWAMPTAMGGATYVGFLFSMMAQNGFTANRKLLTWYQTLPLRPIPLAAGMVVGMTATLFCIRFATATVALAVSVQHLHEMIAILFAFLAFDLAFASIKNLVSASTDLNPMPQGTPDIFHGAKGMLFMLLMGFAMIPTMVIATITVGVVGAIAGYTWTPCSLAAALSLLAQLPVIWWLSGHRFMNRELACE